MSSVYHNIFYLVLKFPISRQPSSLTNFILLESSTTHDYISDASEDVEVQPNWEYFAANTKFSEDTSDVKVAKHNLPIGAGQQSQVRSRHSWKACLGTSSFSSVEALSCRTLSYLKNNNYKDKVYMFICVYICNLMVNISRSNFSCIINNVTYTHWYTYTGTSISLKIKVTEIISW